VTASAFTGRWGETAYRMAEWLLRHEALHVLATDSHDTKNRPPNLSAARDAVEELRGIKVAQALVDDNPRAVITGKRLSYFPDLIMKD